MVVAVFAFVLYSLLIAVYTSMCPTLTKYTEALVNIFYDRDYIIKGGKT